MQDHERQHSLADTAQRIASAARIAWAAAAGDVHGAAIVTAKEAAPLLVKLAICITILLILY